MSDDDTMPARILALARERYSYNAIAKLLGVSRNVVAGAIFRARERGESIPTSREAESQRHVAVGGIQGRSRCCYPIGDPRNSDFKFCGQPAKVGRPYCAAHCALCYQPLSAPRSAADG